MLIPDTLEDEKSFLRGLVETGVIPGDGKTISRIKCVYYSWVVDSICADSVAPFDDYYIDTELSQLFCTS
jgi:hypothetical protein